MTGDGRGWPMASRGPRCTVLQDGQFTALRNKFWSLNFLQILMIFCNKNPQFCEVFTNFQIKTAKIVIFDLANCFARFKQLLSCDDVLTYLLTHLKQTLNLQEHT